MTVHEIYHQVSSHFNIEQKGEHGSTLQIAGPEEEDFSNELSSSFPRSPKRVDKNRSSDDTAVVVNVKLLLLFTVLGIGALFPYNALISCIDWFEYLHPSSGDDGQSAIEGKIAASELTSLTLTTLLLLPLSSRQLHVRTAWTTVLQKSVALPTRRIYFGFVFVILLLLILAFASPSTVAILMISFFTGVGDAIIQSGVFVLAANIHPQCTASVSLGNAIAGLAVSVLRLVTKAIWGSRSMRVSSCLFFIVCVFFILFCIWVTTKVSKADRTCAEIEIDSTEAAQEDSPVLKKKPNKIEDERSHSVFHHHLDESNLLSIYVIAISFVWKPVFTTFFNFFVTLALFPGAVTVIPSSGWIDSQWLPVLLITIFNAFDFLGRAVLNDMFGMQRLSNYLLRPKTEHSKSHDSFHSMVFIPCILRIVFFPLILKLQVNDLLTCFIVSCLGLSNGFNNCACFMTGPEMVENDLKEAASLLLLLASFLGLFLGAFLGLFFC